MTQDELLQELATLNYSGRMRRMYEVGRLALTDNEAATILTAMEQGGTYERLLSLQACYGNRDSEHILRALADPSGLVRHLAIWLVVKVCDDAQVERAFELVSPHLLTLLMRRLAHKNRQKVIDAFLQKGLQSLKLTAFGSKNVVPLPEILDSGSWVEWVRVAKHHPTLLIKALQQKAEAETYLNRHLLHQVNSVLGILAKASPDDTLHLVKTVSQHNPLGKLELEELLEQRPTEIAELVLSFEDKVDLDFTSVLHKLATPLLLKILQRYPALLEETYTWFPKITPEKRQEVYQVVARGWQNVSWNEDGSIESYIIKLLPSDLREAEARRYMTLPTLATNTSQKLYYATFLPWDEALAILEPFTRDPDPALREAALTGLIDAVRYKRDKLEEVLTIILFHRNEQDPIRSSIFSNLESLPIGIWQLRHLAMLDQIIQDALDAADMSYNTGYRVQEFVLQLLPSYPDWSANWSSIIARKRGSINFPYRTESRLTDDDIRKTVPALLPVFEDWLVLGYNDKLIHAARSLESRLHVFDRLLDILEKVLRNITDPKLIKLTLELIAKQGYARLNTLIPALLQEDASWITQPIVYNYLDRHRQDLLTPFLGQQIYKGRFNTGEVAFILPLEHNNFSRWTPEQQVIFGETLSQVTRDDKRDNPTIINCINQLAKLAYIEPDTLIDLTSDNRQALRDSALRALGRLDNGGEGVTVLVEAMTSDRARIAIYALRRIILRMSPASAIELLRNVQLERVTVAKEVVRLLGELHSDAAYQELLRFNKEDLHRDIRIALLRALWGYLERDATWPILEKAAASSESAIAIMVSRTFSERMSLKAQTRLLALLAVLLTNPNPNVRVAVLKRCRRLPITDSQKLLLPYFLTALNSKFPTEVRSAASALFATYAGQDLEVISPAIANILPNRRNLFSIIEGLESRLDLSPRLYKAVTLEILSAIESDPLTINLQIKLAIQTLSWSELSSYFERLASTNRLSTGAMIQTIERLDRWKIYHSEPAEVTTFEKTLAASSDERLRRIALAVLVQAAQDSRGWTDERIERLKNYRADSSILVAAEAQFIFPPNEDEPKDSPVENR